MSIFTVNDYEKIIYSVLSYEQNYVSTIDGQGRHIYLNSPGDLAKCSGNTIKIEGLEKYSLELDQFCKNLGLKFNHRGPVTCHAFKAYPNSMSFGLHKDIYDVYLLIIDGTKHMWFDGSVHELTVGQTLFMPANSPHAAINKHESLMLSFGLEPYITDQLS